MRGPGFIHLHVHSAFSLLEWAVQLESILKLAAADAQPALGLADTANLFGALEFSEKATKKGIQPLIGLVELRLHALVRGGNLGQFRRCCAVDLFDAFGGAIRPV